MEATTIILERLNLYGSRRGQELSGIVTDLLIAGAASIVLLGATAFLLRVPVSPVFPLLCGLSQFAALGSMRFVILGGLRWLRRRGKNYRNVLVIGSGPRAYHVEQSIEAHPEWGLRLVGFVDETDWPADERIDPEKVHKLVEVPSILRDTVVDEVIVACPRSMLSIIASAEPVTAAARCGSALPVCARQRSAAACARADARLYLAMAEPVFSAMTPLAATART